MTQKTTAFLQRHAEDATRHLATALARTDRSILDELRTTYHRATITELAKAIRIQLEGQDHSEQRQTWAERARKAGIIL